MTVDLQTQQRLLYLEGYIRRLAIGGSGYSVPVGGTTGQVLGKVSGLDGDVDWLDMGISPDGTFTICDGTIDGTGAIVGAFFELTDGSP